MAVRVGWWAGKAKAKLLTRKIMIEQCKKRGVVATSPHVVTRVPDCFNFNERQVGKPPPLSGTGIGGYAHIAGYRRCRTHRLFGMRFLAEAAFGVRCNDSESRDSSSGPLFIFVPLNPV